MERFRNRRDVRCRDLLRVRMNGVAGHGAQARCRPDDLLVRRTRFARSPQRIRRAPVEIRHGFRVGSFKYFYRECMFQILWIVILILKHESILGALLSNFRGHGNSIPLHLRQYNVDWLSLKNNDVFLVTKIYIGIIFLHEKILLPKYFWGGY